MLSNSVTYTEELFMKGRVNWCSKLHCFFKKLHSHSNLEQWPPSWSVSSHQSARSFTSKKIGIHWRLRWWLAFFQLWSINRLHYRVSITLYALENQKICGTHFIVIFTLLQWSGTKPVLSLKYVCITTQHPDLEISWLLSTIPTAHS